MPMPITCTCGAQFDADDALAGRQTRCPECQASVAVPATDRATPRTSLFALQSAIYALVGAFTVIGTVCATVLGVAALIQIRRNKETLAGTGLAVFGILAGVVLTALTLFALNTNELFGLGSPTHLSQLGSEVDTSGPMEVVAADEDIALTRPSVRWGRARNEEVDDVTVNQLIDEPDLLLVNASRYLFVDVRAAENGKSFERCCDEAVESLQVSHHSLPVFGRQIIRSTVRKTRQLPCEGWAERRELLIDVKCGTQPWIFLVRVQRAASGDVYVTRGFTQRRRFAGAEAELRRALDSFRLLTRW